MLKKKKEPIVYWCPLHGEMIPEKNRSCAWSGDRLAGPGMSQHMKRWHPDDFKEWNNPDTKYDRMQFARIPPQKRTTDWRTALQNTRSGAQPTIKQERIAPRQYISNEAITVSEPRSSSSTAPTPQTPVDLVLQAYNDTLRRREDVRRQIADTRNLEQQERRLTEEAASIAQTLATMGHPVSTSQSDTPQTTSNVASTTTEVHAASEPEFQHA